MKRQLMPDLIRSVAILFLLNLHFIAGTGWYTLPNSGLSMLLINIIRVLLITCVPLFLILSGYLCWKKTLSARYYLGLVHIYLIYFLACIACLLVKGLYLHTPMDLRYILGSVVNHYACDYSWYVAMYTGLFLMIPFLNLAFWGLKSRLHRQVLVWTMIFLGIAPSLFNMRFNLYYTWWVQFYPLAYYFLGMYLHEYPPSLSRKKGLVLLLLSLLTFGLLNYFYSRPDVFQWEDFTWFGGFECLCVSTLLFILLSSADLTRFPSWLKKGIRILARYSFGIYLFSFIPDTFFHPLLRMWVQDPMARFWFFLPCVAATLIVSLLLAWLAEAIAAPLEKRLRNGLTALWRRLAAASSKGG